MQSTKPLSGVPPKRILIVEDNEMTARALLMALVADGHQVEVTQSGEKALELFSAGNYDLIFTDFKLPRMDGLELAQAIKQTNPSIPVILMTAYAEAVGRAGNISNIDFLLGKPFSLSALHEGLRKFFPTEIR